MKKYEGGGNVFNKTSEELKQMSPKERQQFERQRAYNEGIKNAEKGTVKGSVSQAIDQTLGPQTSGERTMRTKGYKDMLKAKEYQEKANKKESPSTSNFCMFSGISCSKFFKSDKNSNTSFEDLATVTFSLSKFIIQFYWFHSLGFLLQSCKVSNSLLVMYLLSKACSNKNS